MIILKNISKDYKVDGEVIPVLDNINLHVREGEMLAIMGRSGCGKSTLLNIMGGILTPASGEVWVEGKKINFAKEKQLYALRRNLIGYVVQNFALISRKTVFENVILSVRDSEYKKNHYAKVKMLLKELGLEEKINKYPYQLSNGEKQRTAIARALVNRKKIILADEPTGALDYANAENVVSIMRRLVKEKGITVVIVTHDQEIAEKCDRIVHITYGKLEKV